MVEHLEAFKGIDITLHDAALYGEPDADTETIDLAEHLETALEDKDTVLLHGVVFEQIAERIRALSAELITSGAWGE